MSYLRYRGFFFFTPFLSVIEPKGEIQLKASDDLPGHEVNQGNHISLYVVFSDSTTKQEVFDGLASGGKVLFPLTEDFGMLKDKYGVQWMFVHE